MLAFAVIALAVGAGLAWAVTMRQFAIGSLFLLVAGFAQALHVGVPLGQACLGAIGLFFCGQFGYVMGMAVTALASVRTKQSTEQEKTVSAAPEEQEPIVR